MRIAKPAGDRGSPIAALRAEAGISQHVMHQGRDAIGHLGKIEPLLAGPEREAESRQGWRHHGECVARIAAESRRICQARDELEKLEHRSWPAMQQEQRHRIWTDAGHVEIVNVDAVERNAELRKSIQGGFRSPPVEMAPPIFGEIAKVADVGAVGPGIAGCLVWET